MIHGLKEFVRQSNTIEGILRQPYKLEVDATQQFLDRGLIAREPLLALLKVYAPDAKLRDKKGLDVRVGRYFPPPGGPEVGGMLDHLLHRMAEGRVSAYHGHQEFERLHPFLDGNGRTGRVLWARQMLNNGHDPFKLGFLHLWYYQSLDEQRSAATWVGSGAA